MTTLLTMTAGSLSWVIQRVGQPAVHYFVSQGNWKERKMIIAKKMDTARPTKPIILVIKRRGVSSPINSGCADFAQPTTIEGRKMPKNEKLKKITTNRTSTTCLKTPPILNANLD